MPVSDRRNKRLFLLCQAILFNLYIHTPLSGLNICCEIKPHWTDARATGREKNTSVGLDWKTLWPWKSFLFCFFHLLPVKAATAKKPGWWDSVNWLIGPLHNTAFRLSVDVDINNKLYSRNKLAFLAHPLWSWQNKYAWAAKAVESVFQRGWYWLYLCLFSHAIIIFQQRKIYIYISESLMRCLEIATKINLGFEPVRKRKTLIPAFLNHPSRDPKRKVSECVFPVFFPTAFTLFLSLLYAQYPPASLWSLSASAGGW